MSDEDSSSSLDGFGSLVRLAGRQVPARAQFIGRSIFAGLYAGTTIGLVCGQLSMMATPFGPLVPFLVGSGAGFCLGLYRSWKESVQITCLYARHYPEILAHELWRTFHIRVTPTQQQKMEGWVLGQGIGHLSFCVLSAELCRQDVTEVERQERQRLVEAKGRKIEQEKLEELD